MDGDQVGFHFVAFTGIDLDPKNGAPPFIRIENSWGPGWGQNGTARLTIEDFHRLNRYENYVFTETSF
jgi:aminopeptidase C